MSRPLAMNRLRFSFFCLWLFSVFACANTPGKEHLTEQTDALPPDTVLQTGAEQISELLSLLNGKDVALVVNQTSVVGSQHVHLLDTLLSLGIKVKKVFAPEHGFRGDADAGEAVENGKDSRTGIPIISLYGKNKKPATAQLQDVDLVVFDIQDVGARFYTYISTMTYVMEACAANGKEFLVLDRPNPCDYIDGPVLQKPFRSFVGLLPVPLLHGCTVGELALMIKGEKWISAADSCRLNVVKVKNWKHGQPYSLPIKPSPNLPNDRAIALYPSLCLFEATGISVGRGTTFPFQVIGAPDKKYGRFSFTPRSLAGFDKKPLHKDASCYGVDLRDGEIEKGFTLSYFLDFYKKGGKGSAFFTNTRWFDLLMGTDATRTAIVNGKSEEEIKAGWETGLNAYKAIRNKYIMY